MLEEVKRFGLAIHHALGTKRYALTGIVSVTAAAAGLLSERVQGSALITWVPFPLVAAGVAALVFVFGCVALRVVDLESQIRGARHQLSVLRTQGVEIRNRGLRLTRKTWPRWRDEASLWSSDVIREMQKIDRGMAEWFNTLDVVPAPRLPFSRLHQRQSDLFCQHDYRVMRLGELIREVWRTEIVPSR
jgi:hypothetical protein